MSSQTSPNTFMTMTNPENPIGPRPTTTANNPGSAQLVPQTDAFMMAWQVGARLTFPNSIYVQLAPTLYNYTGNGDTFNIHYVGEVTRPCPTAPRWPRTRPASTACWFLIYQRKSAGKPGACRCASSVSSLTISRVTIAHMRPQSWGDLMPTPASITLG